MLPYPTSTTLSIAEGGETTSDIHPPVVELILVGRELLRGRTRDTNGFWIARLLADRGLELRRWTTVDDREQEIADAVRGGLSRRAGLLVLSGGLGPTAEDRTVAALATALDRGLTENEAAERMVREFYLRMTREGRVGKAGLTPSRRKMARLPEGAIPVPNSVGAAPGLLLELGPARVLALPGVPAEMRAVLITAVPMLGALLTGARAVSRRIDLRVADESELAGRLDAAAEAHPSVWIKSHPARFDPGAPIPITLETSGPAGEDLERRLDDVEALLRR